MPRIMRADLVREPLTEPEQMTEHTLRWGLSVQHPLSSSVSAMTSRVLNGSTTRVTA